ncbi:MAG: glycosyl hydrolase, partial [Bacteroidota bacterium]
MDRYRKLGFRFEPAICYSGYREGQSPDTGVYPSYDEIKEDLDILEGRWKYLRLYDCSRHAEVVLSVIEKEGMDFQVMLGAYIAAEVSNPNCPWGAMYPNGVLRNNQKKNEAEIEKLIELANQYPDI